MHFFEGSEHPLHQDQFYLPDCISAWIAIEDSNQLNGPLLLQPKSHLGELITKTGLPELNGIDNNYDNHQKKIYFPRVNDLAKKNNIPIIKVFAKQGDVIFFHGKLIHGGSKVINNSSSRHSLACHYIPFNSNNWDRDWPRFSFDRKKRVKYRLNS